MAGEKYVERVFSIDSAPRKSNSSYGSWVVDYISIINYPESPEFGNRKNQCYRFFWKKADAIAWIEKTNVVNG